MIDVQKLLHPLATHFNKFDSFVKRRDAFLFEIDAYLKRRISGGGYQAWQSCVGVCNKATMTHLIWLQVFVKNTERNVVLLPLVELENRICSAQSSKRSFGSYTDKELARLLHEKESDKGSIQIRRTDHRKALTLLHAQQDSYRRTFQDARGVLQDTMEREYEATLFKKNEEGFMSLLRTMIEPRGNLEHISPDQFPLPDIRQLRENWRAIGDKEA
jgi:hypothetical protein